MSNAFTQSDKFTLLCLLQPNMSYCQHNLKYKGKHVLTCISMPLLDGHLKKKKKKKSVKKHQGWVNIFITVTISHKTVSWSIKTKSLMYCSSPTVNKINTWPLNFLPRICWTVHWPGSLWFTVLLPSQERKCYLFRERGSCPTFQL